MDKLTRREILDLLARGGFACGGACALSRFAILDALAEDAADKDPFQVATIDFASEPGRKLSRLGFGMMRLPCKGRNQIDEETGGDRPRKALVKQHFYLQRFDPK